MCRAPKFTEARPSPSRKEERDRPMVGCDPVLLSTSAGDGTSLRGSTSCLAAPGRLDRFRALGALTPEALDVERFRGRLLGSSPIAGMDYGGALEAHEGKVCRRWDLNPYILADSGF